MTLVQKIEETVKFKVPKNKLFTLGKLIQDQKADGWKLDNVMKGIEYVYPVFVRN